jgi:hypothetical protein
VQSTDRDKQVQEREFLGRRQNFKTGRELLLSNRVPFDPDELLRDGWHQKLKPTLDAMLEMHETRHESQPLTGAYLADTIYLPEQVQLTGHTVILANYVVFEGKNPVIKGNFDLHFFPTKPVVVLETTLAEALQKKSHVLNVKFGRKILLPSFALIQDVVKPGAHHITFDVSGVSIEPSPRPKPTPRLRNTSWSGFPIFPVQQKQCTISCDNNGDNGAPGATGRAGAPGVDGTVPAKAPNGSCTDIINGHGGFPGGDGDPGISGGNGEDGRPGQDSKGILVMIAPGDTNVYTFIANGGNGGRGGDGGDGGNGGDGSRGGDGGDGVECQCEVGDGGDAGHGGNGGNAGAGGNGGNGGNGGKGGTISGTYPANGTRPEISAGGGIAAGAGIGGGGGVGGMGGVQGQPGNGGSGCGKTGARGFGNFVGKGGASGSTGKTGSVGQNGPLGTVNVTPSTTTVSGGGGVTPNPCLNGATASPTGSGAFTTNPGPGVTPTCSPIIVDTRGEGFPLTSAQAGVKFDITGTGQPVQLAWTERGSHDAFLALPGSDGLVHNGKELFGNFTPQPASANPNGFLALAEFDKPENGGNGDGIIDERDAVFSRLRLWIDENHDGVCQVNELHPLPELGVFSLALRYRESRRTDDFGNQFRYGSMHFTQPLNRSTKFSDFRYFFVACFQRVCV